MTKFEVALHYEGSRTYFVEANSKEEAEDKARILYENGDDGESTSAEYEKPTSIDAMSMV